METTAENKNDRQFIKNEFKAAIEKLAELTKRVYPDSNVLAYTDPELPTFTALSSEDQEKVLTGTQVFLNTWMTLEKEKFNLRSEQQFLWRAMQMNDIRLPSDCLDKIKTDEFIEVYDLNGIHLWYNLRYFTICSHTVEDIRCIPWNDRYLRQPIIDQHCFEAIQEAMMLEQPEVINCKVPEHIVDEVESTLLYKLQVTFKKIAPIYKAKSDEKIGFIVTAGCKILEAQRSLEEYEKLHLQEAARNSGLTLVPPPTDA